MGQTLCLHSGHTPFGLGPTTLRPMPPNTRWWEPLDIMFIIVHLTYVDVSQGYDAYTVRPTTPTRPYA